jgi:cellulose synthase operon protein C
LRTYALAALERVRTQEFEGRKKQAQAAFVESENDKKFAEALDLYAALFPEDPELARLFFRQGKFYYESGVYDPAVRIFGSLLERFPRSEEALPSGQMILESFNRSKNFDNVEQWARRLKTAPSFQSAESQQKLEGLIVQSVFKQGEAKSDAGEYAAAAAAYLRAAREFPKEPRAAQACINAELAAQKAGDLRTLKEAALLVTGKEYRDRPESPQGAWIAASTFQSLGLFAEAAEIQELMMQAADKEHPHYLKYEHTKDAGYNAVLLRATTGEHDKAIANGNRFLAVYQASAEADEVAFHMARAHLSAGRTKEAIETYRRFVARTRSSDKRAQAFVQLALALKKQGDLKASDESLRAAALLGRKGSDLGIEGKYAAAHARYLEGERVLGRFDEILIQGDVKQLAQRLKQKADLLKQASIIFLDTVSMGVAEWSTAALYQIGRTYETFAKALREAPIPPSLSEADKTAYQEQIDQFVVPIEERALDAYENGWKKAVDLGIFNQWTAKMREALGRLNGELYPPFKEIGFEVRSQSAEAMPALLEAPKRVTDVKPKAEKKASR